MGCGMWMHPDCSTFNRIVKIPWLYGGCWPWLAMFGVLLTASFMS
ncbi:hypothetical protein AHF37_09035 [Paragonimus kellicotti]|nr:hypothetical protein AHF37_09035 [Paragonimus kellicotti]